jgi:hypothetical protein
MASVLVNFVNWAPVGHAVEAVHTCLGYHRADPSRRIGLVLNSRTATDIASWCPFIDDVYTVDLDPTDGSAVPALNHIPREWDWVVSDARGFNWHRSAYPGMARYYDICAEYFVGKHAVHDMFLAGPREPSYVAGQQLSLDLPPVASLPEHDGPTIAVLPAGSDERWWYPSTASWRSILAALRERLPTARFCFVGKLAADSRTSTAFSRNEFDELAAVVPGAVSVVDRPLAEQLAAVQRCDLLLSPHTGYAFAAMAVGTPWLVLAGNKWYEHYFNPGVPFYSVLPDVSRFPCYVWLGHDPSPVADDGPRSPSMSAARIRADLPELLDAATRLIAGEWDYPTAMADHFARMAKLAGGDTDRLFTFDNLHTEYLPR